MCAWPRVTSTDESPRWKSWVVDEPIPEHLAAVLSDLNMLRGPGGCERTETEHRALLSANGFRVMRIVPAGPNSLIEATVV
jgi:hypothetical protein